MTKYFTLFFADTQKKEPATQAQAPSFLFNKVLSLSLFKG
jgi:hypothetical protein